MPLPRYIDFETISTCNRTCPTCIRNSHPDKQAVASFFRTELLPASLIADALDQAVAMGFTGGVCLSHYNEPLMDERLPEIARMVSRYNLHPLFLHTNGDLLTPEIAAALDGVLDYLTVSLYMDEPVKSNRAAWITTLFEKSSVNIITQSDHIPTHFSPAFDVARLAERYREHPCAQPEMRAIINHRRQFLLCCSDVVGAFNLGTFPETSLSDHWDNVQTILAELRKSGGRHWHPHCENCPQP